MSDKECDPDSEVDLVRHPDDKGVMPVFVQIAMVYRMLGESDKQYPKQAEKLKELRQQTEKSFELYRSGDLHSAGEQIKEVFEALMEMAHSAPNESQ